MRTQIIVAVVVVVVGCAPETAVQARARLYQAALDRAQFSMTESIEAAEAETVDGVGFRAELVVVDVDVPMFAIGAVDPEAPVGRQHEVRVDAVSGAVVSLAEVTGVLPDVCLEVQALPAAIESAGQAVEGDVVTIAPDDDGGCNRELHVLRDSTLWSVKLAHDGALISEEEDDDAD